MNFMRCVVLYAGVFLMFLSGASYVHGQLNNQYLKTYGCISAVLCNDKNTNHSDNINCPSTRSDEHDIYPHRTRVFNTTPLEPNTEVYVTECVNTTQGWICTTGNSKIDKKLFCGDENATNPVCDHFALLHDTNINPNGYYLYPDPVNQNAWVGYTVYYSNNSNYSTRAEALAARVDLRRTASENERGPVITDANGRLPIIEWQAFTYPETNRRYAAYQILSVTPTPTPIGSSATPTPTPVSVGGQQQGTLSFATPTPFTPAPGNCDTVSYDPYGRVFDAVTLEPIPRAQISLLQQNPSTKEFSLAYAQQVNLVSLNPQLTHLDGGFSFLVVDGTYQLQPAMEGYQFVNQASIQLPRNTNKIYSDLYYQNSPAIVQDGQIQHRDIPLQPTNNIGKKYDLQKDWQSEEPVLAGTKQMIRYAGKLSHPFVKMDVYKCIPPTGGEAQTCNFVKTYPASQGGPDQYGSYSVDLDQSKLRVGETYKIEFTPQEDLATAQLSQKTTFQRIIAWVRGIIQPQVVHAQEARRSITQIVEPIMAYIEGYAYGIDGIILPGAQVQIRVPHALVPVHATQADATGYYRITSEFLPQSSYTIVYIVNNAEVAQLTTSQFLTQNKEFTEAENIDPMTRVTASTNPRRNITPSFMPQQQIAALPVTPTAKQAPSPASLTQDSKNVIGQNRAIYLVGAIILLLLGGAGSLIALHMYRKRSSDSADI